MLTIRYSSIGRKTRIFFLQLWSNSIHTIIFRNSVFLVNTGLQLEIRRYNCVHHSFLISTSVVKFGNFEF